MFQNFKIEFKLQVKYLQYECKHTKLYFLIDFIRL